MRVLEQLDLLGEHVVPVLRREMDALRPAHVPDAPTRASRVLAAQRAEAGTTTLGARLVTTGRAVSPAGSWS